MVYPYLEQNILFYSNGLAIWSGFPDMTHIKKIMTGSDEQTSGLTDAPGDDNSHPPKIWLRPKNSLFFLGTGLIVFIDHTFIMLKSQLPTFFTKKSPGFPFPENLCSLYNYIIVIRLWKCAYFSMNATRRQSFIVNYMKI